MSQGFPIGSVFDNDPIGSIKPWPTAVAPSGTLICDGSAVSRTTYADLFAVIGTTWGAGNGSTTFNIPDFRGRVLIGSDAGGVNLPVNHPALAATGGEEQHTLTGPESGIQAHFHQYSNGTNVGSFGGSGNFGGSNTVTFNTTTVGPTSASNAHNNLQPYAAVTWVIRYASLYTGPTNGGAASGVLGGSFPSPSFSSYPHVQPIINGGMDFFQRQTPATLTSYPNGSFSADRWYMLGDSGATDIQMARVDEGANGQVFRYSAQVKNSNAGSKHTGVAQIVESRDSMKFRGQTVTLQAYVKTGTAGRAMRAAIIEWTGTADAVAFGGGVTRDPVLSWASTNYTAGNFFRNVTLTVDGVSSSYTPGTSYGILTVTGTVTTNCSNLVLMIWEESATPAAGTWNLSGVQLVVGSVTLPYLPLSIEEELARCQRYMCKTFDIDSSIGDNVTFNGALVSQQNVILPSVNWRFPVQMRTTPTITMYSPGGGTAGQWRNGSNTVSTANARASNTTGSGTYLDNGGVGVASDTYEIHATAQAEI